MRLKSFTILLFLMLSQSCDSLKSDVYNEKNYLITKTDFFKGIVDREIYTNKYDTSRKMTKYYFDNGRLMSKSFSNKMQIDGNFEVYSIDEKLITTDLYKNGQRVSTKRSKPLDTTISIFRNGKLEKLYTE